MRQLNENMTEKEREQARKKDEDDAYRQEIQFLDSEGRKQSLEMRN